ncbi:unnamed protein product, partial [Leptidea sinapis]
MSSIQERLQQKRVPLDTWNKREQLCLASAVVRSGDQNWMSVSRALKTIGEPNRPPDWYSQKSCAAQYGALLENVETPKRKRNSDSGIETPQECILKQLTEQRIQEIQKTIAEMTEQHDIIKNAIAEVQDPETSDARIREIWADIEATKRAREREIVRRAAWLKERDERRARAERSWRPTVLPISPSTTFVSSAAPSSPLLTSLLKSSPVVTTPQRISHPANAYVDAVAPSVGAPTLSLLLEQPSVEKNAAIEHIKSQLVQIEHQLKANTQNRTVPLAPTVDIDDIEIKAEDVYAFKDIDINIPPVASMHKASPREKIIRKVGDDMFIHVSTEEGKKKDQVLAPPPQRKAVPVPEPFVPDDEEMVHLRIQQPLKKETAVEHKPALKRPKPAMEPIVVAPKPEVKISFPEVKFPTPEIKVIEPEDTKVFAKEEIQPKPESAFQVKFAAEEKSVAVQEETQKVEFEKELQKETVAEETAPVVENEKEKKAEEEIIQAKTEEKPEQVIEAEEPPPAELVSQADMQKDGQKHAILPQDIPLPPEEFESEENEVIEPVKDPTPSPEQQEPVNETVEELKKDTVKDAEQETENDIKTEDEEDLKQEDKRDEDEEDSIPLMEMIREEASLIADARMKQEYDTHTETDDDTPMELSREEEKDGKKKRDYSRKKKPDSRTCSGSESAPDSPSSNDTERQHRLWKKSVMLVYNRLCAHKYASLFLRPITDDEAPGYSAIVKRPMDLSTIRKNIDAGNVRTTAEFQRDVLLMLSNALIYNNSTHSVYAMAKEMFEE